MPRHRLPFKFLCEYVSSGHSRNSLCRDLNWPAVGMLDVIYIEDRSLLPSFFQTNICFGMYLGLPGLQATGRQRWESVPQIPAVPSSYVSQSPHPLGPRQGEPLWPLPRSVLCREEPLFLLWLRQSRVPISPTALTGFHCVSQRDCIIVSQNQITRNYKMSEFKGILLVF